MAAQFRGSGGDALREEEMVMMVGQRRFIGGRDTEGCRSTGADEMMVVIGNGAESGAGY